MQAVDSAKLSLVEFARRANFASVDDVSRRDLTAAVKTVYWAYGLCHATGIYKAHGLERHFEPGAFRQNKNGDPYRLNKWSKYLKGQNEPRSVLASVQEICPGANGCLRSPVWPALSPGPLTRHQIRRLLLQLTEPIQELISRHGLWPSRTVAPRKLFNKTLANALEHRASLDTFGAVVLLLRQAYAEDDREAAYGWSEQLWRMLVLLGPQFVRGGVAGALAELIEARIMPMADLDGIRFGFPPGHYMKVVVAFTKARTLAVRLYLTGRPPHSHWQWVSMGRRLLTPDLGWDYRFAFNPIRLIDKDAWLLGQAEPAPGEARYEQHGRWCHEWALNMLSRGGHPTLPPEAVWTGQDLWATDPDDPVTLMLAKREASRSTH